MWKDVPFAHLRALSAFIMMSTENETILFCIRHKEWNDGNPFNHFTHCWPSPFPFIRFFIIIKWDNFPLSFFLSLERTKTRESRADMNDRHVVWQRPERDRVEFSRQINVYTVQLGERERAGRHCKAETTASRRCCCLSIFNRTNSSSCKNAEPEKRRNYLRSFRVSPFFVSSAFRQIRLSNGDDVERLFWAPTLFHF